MNPVEGREAGGVAGRQLAHPGGHPAHLPPGGHPVHLPPGGHPAHLPPGASAVMMLPRLVGGLRCLDVIREMEEHLVILTGARDRKGTPILTFPQNPRRERAKAEDYKRLLDYLLGVPW